MILNEIEKYQIEILINHLKTAYPEDFNGMIEEDLKNKLWNSNQNFMTISRELNSVLIDRTKLAGLFAKYQITQSNKEEVIAKKEQEVQHALNMSDITDFTRNGRTYIKLTYRDGQVQIIENRSGKNTKQIFEDIQKLRILNHSDGTRNAEEAFQELLKDYAVVPLENSMFMNQQQLKREEQSKLNFVQMNFPNNQVLASVSENIFIIKGNPDITVEVQTINGQYTLKQIGEATYGVQNEKKEIINVITERPKETKQEYSVKELKQITEGMTEEEIVEYLRIHGKNPSQIMMMLLSLEEAKAKAATTLEKPKQMVLKAKNTRGKMAAFIDTLYVAFLVGMISGAIFFAMLRFILHSL